MEPNFFEKDLQFAQILRNMSDNKVRSKSIGRVTSRRFKSLDSFKAKVLKHVGKEHLNTVHQHPPGSSNKSQHGRQTIMYINTTNQLAVLLEHPHQTLEISYR